MGIELVPRLTSNRGSRKMAILRITAIRPQPTSGLNPSASRTPVRQPDALVSQNRRWVAPANSRPSCDSIAKMVRFNQRTGRAFRSSGMGMVRRSRAQVNRSKVRGPKAPLEPNAPALGKLGGGVAGPSSLSPAPVRSACEDQGG